MPTTFIGQYARVSCGEGGKGNGESFALAKEICEYIIITSASRVPLRCGTQFASYLRHIVIRKREECVGDNET